MSTIHLYELVEVSNNSRLTNQVHATLNEKLTDNEKQLIIQWLKIVKNEAK